MSTDPNPPATTTPPVAPPAPKAEPNALATALYSGWEQFKRGQLVSYPAMAIILLVVAGVGATVYITRSNRKVESAKWAELDALASVSSLKEFAEKNPNTVQGRVATLEVARTQLGPEGVDRFVVQDPQVRKTAADNVEQARDAFARLADEFKDDPLLRAECLFGAAKAEAALVGMSKDGSADQFRGDPKRAVELLDKAADAAPDTDWGKGAKKLADTLRNQNTQQQVVTLQASVYTMSAPTAPSFDPKAPLGGPGGLGGLGGTPGFPGQ